VHVIVNQLGGKVEYPTFPGGPTLKRTLQIEHDALMRPGEEDVLFLARAADGSYSVLGGAQGRFSVDNRGLLGPISLDAEVARAHSGQTLDSLATEVRALNH
jgi:hypothetical protein